jgi:thioredoxin 1
MKQLSVIWLMVLATAVMAAEKPYNEKADAKADIKQALAAATADKVPVIVVFGANWCEDCQALNQAMTKGTSAPLLAKDFKIVKVDVSVKQGKFDKNEDVAKSYGVPLEKGIPAVVILSADNQVLYATKAGELSDAHKMGEKGIYNFFKEKVTPLAAGKN